MASQQMEHAQTTKAASPSWPKRLGWMALIWSASVLALGFTAGLMRLFMNALGLHGG
ncbi:DUF2474 domain-containing protein [Alloalcanivorax xenomutans]|uniref:DUF2474 domain-containing protein n=1 Tax=Alloalcanivorax xenomutans TaxID=1094342 RepID=A0A9Q3ZGA0_9GAMM|nr:DUF2474 domain-containing protein [Alloalcanivorax xenomutans]MBA4723024.1 DUF2474 domain-containing protein [Alcanivorax sp.]MCE7510691.1 DUF2474 domain-containing protein [Alloalcanivorax xenomutans]MCE7525412.1 DUF2474 domain-containing protein [Alloalcanivorax xenomutans]WOA30275.1 DUF2474 domain-containing protein [Alloalcanivorax xenomutans]SOC00810.1 uncharacterized protein DUF2474 [Alloalcanivorax xenomutans]|tara:strand:- start:319 stop:489 length:171 start_codon:yes stop_codon:yes gene_type:complete